MKILIIGAGAIGGYFGGRLLEAGREVTFLVRPARARQLAETGLVLRSPLGQVTLPSPPTILASELADPFDAVLVSCKAYDLEGAIASFAPAVGPATMILPLLNGMLHLDRLDQQFGKDRVLGGYCMISSTLGQDGAIEHMGPLHALAFGERDGSRSPRAEALEAQLSGAGFDARLSETILQELWEKWVFIATAAGITCLMRAAVGDIVQAGAANLTLALLDECAAIAAGQGFPPRPAPMAQWRALFTDPANRMTASMLRDLERKAPTEADHILGDLLRRTLPREDQPDQLLRLALAHLQCGQARRVREAG